MLRKVTCIQFLRLFIYKRLLSKNNNGGEGHTTERGLKA